MSASPEETLPAWETASSQDCPGPGSAGPVSEFEPVDLAWKVDSVDLALKVNSEEWSMAASR